VIHKIRKTNDQGALTQNLFVEDPRKK